MTITAKDIIIKPIAKRDADIIIKSFHYSHKVTCNSQLCFGVFIDNICYGAMEFGPSLDKRKIQGLVSGTGWNGFIELNRLAFSDKLPRNSESRALSVAIKLIKKHYPHIEWIVSFADGMQCGDGTIYRASGFVLTGISQGSIWKLPEYLMEINNGNSHAHRMSLQDKSGNLSKYILSKCNGSNFSISDCVKRFGGSIMPGYMFRYIYFISPTARQRLTVPEIPFSKIEEMKAGLYKGKPISRAGISKVESPALQRDNGGSNPTPALQ